MKKYKFFILKGLNYNKQILHGQLSMDMLALRITGYLPYYGNKLMPIDLYDYFSDHLVLCEQVNDEYIPVSCLRTIPYSNCIKNDVEFLPISRVAASNHKVKLAIKELLLRTKSNLNYDSGLTISPKITSKVENYYILKHMIGLCLTYHKKTKNMPFIISSIRKTKTDKLFKKVGFTPLCKKNDYSLKGLESEGFSMLKYEFEQDKYIQWSENSKSLWEDKIEIGVILNKKSSPIIANSSSKNRDEALA